MSSTCLVCGSNYFQLEDGINACIECGSHQLNFVELVDEEEAWDPNRSRFYIDPEALSKKGIKVRTEDTFDWSYIEAYNIILKRWTDILIQYGASDKFKDAVFKLWACYLQKRGLAFCKNEETEISKEERVGVYQTRDMVVLKKAKIIEKEKKEEEKTEPGDLDRIKEKVRKKELKMRDSTNKSSMSRFLTNQMSETLNTVNNYEEEKMEVDDQEEQVVEKGKNKVDASQFERSTLMLEELFNDDPTTEEKGEEEETAEETEIQPEDEITIYKQNKKHILHNENKKYSTSFIILSPMCLNLEKLLSILYLGLLLSEEHILLLDLLRWCREDFLPFQSAGYLLPKNKLFQAGDSYVFNRAIPTAVELRYYAGSMALYLSLQTLPLPSAENVFKKYFDILRLPDDLRRSALQTFQSYMFRSYSKTSVPPIETCAAAAILLCFKITFGLDDVHEDILSDCADTMNKILKAENRKLKLFSWRKWHMYMNRLMHWTDQMMVSNWSKRRQHQLKEPTNVQRFNSYFWSKGIWRSPIDHQYKKYRGRNGSTWDSILLLSSLGLNMKKMKHVVENEPLFCPYETPFIDLVDQYLCGARCYDDADDSEEKFKIAEKLSSESYTSHLFNWVLHRQEVIYEFQEFGRYIDIVKIPLESSEKCRRLIAKSEKKNVDIIYVPDPLKCYRPIDDNKSISVEKLPANFQWMLRLLCRICETNDGDILKQFVRMEKMFLTTVGRGKKNGRKLISIAEGENIRDIKM